MNACRSSVGDSPSERRAVWHRGGRWGRLPTRAQPEEVRLAGCILPLCWTAAPAEFLPGGAAALHRGETSFLPVWGTGSCQELALCEVVLAAFRTMRSCFASLPPSPLWGLYGTLLVHYVVRYPASNLNSFTVTAFREQWYSVQLRLARSSLKLLKPIPLQKPRINWMWWCLFHVFNKQKVRFW